jgi:hypothetical protein
MITEPLDFTMAGSYCLLTPSNQKEPEMPTAKRRMMLSLPDEVTVAFDDFREATGTAPASFVVQLLMEALPIIQAMTNAANAAKTNRLQAVTIMQDAMASALHQGTAAQLDMYEATTSLRKARSGHKRKSKP